VETYFRHVDPDGRRWKSGDLTAPGGRGPRYEWKGIVRNWRVTRENMAKIEREGRIFYTRQGIPRLKQYLGDLPGMPLQDLWTDVEAVRSWHKEILEYPTQKPLALLERIITASSNPGDVVLDPFCGCGTAVVAAQKLGRQWIGVDITHLAVALIKYRLGDTFDLKEKVDYDVIGEPATASDARALFQKDPYEFQKWAVGLVPRAFPHQEKKGSDTGIDGVLRFKDDANDPKRCMIQVKGGKVSVKEIRDFRGVIEREKATLGLFITLQPPTGPMRREADSVGFYTTPLGNRKIPRLQIRTIAQLLEERAFMIPSAALLYGVKQAAEIRKDPGQEELDL